MNNILFQQNLLSVTSLNPELSVALSSIEPASYVSIEKAGNNSRVPVIKKRRNSFQLHSLYNPEKEAEKLFMSDTNKKGFLIILGLGGGYHIYPYLRDPQIENILIIDTDIKYLKKIIQEISLTEIFTNRKINLLIDPGFSELQKSITDNYLPSILGNMKMIYLNNRVLTEKTFFNSITTDIQKIIDIISDDFASQAYFGKRWFKNILENLKYADNYQAPLKSASKALIAGAGPSLESQLKSIKSNRKGSILFAADTAAGFLINNGVIPDYIVSIDCQHITYNHFLDFNNYDIPLILDIASPVFLSKLFKNRIYFTSSNPFSKYIASVWRYLQYIDTSGGNVGQTAVAIAKTAGIEDIFLYGLDYSYPSYKPYAKDTFLYNYFRHRENRFNSADHSIYAFTSDSNVFKSDKDNVITTDKLDKYYRHLQAYINDFNLNITAPGSIRRFKTNKFSRSAKTALTIFSSGNPVMPWQQFLQDYYNVLSALPVPVSPFNKYFSELHKKEKELWTTVFPICASIRKEIKEDYLSTSDILEKAVKWSLSAVKKAIDEK